MRRLHALRSVYSRYPTFADGVIAAVVLAFVAAGIGISLQNAPPGYERPATVVLIGVPLLMIVPLAGRWPLLVLAVVTAAFIAFRVLGIREAAFSGNVYFLALLSAGAYTDHRLRSWGRAASLAAIFGLWLYRAVSQDYAGFGGSILALQLYSLLSAAVMFGLGWFVGDTMRARRRHEAALEAQTAALADRTQELEQEREANAHRAVLAERVRIARELHDVVAHHVSVMGVQAGGARHVLARAPDQAQQALTAIEASSRQAVQELHRLLGFLRHSDETDGLAPQPSLEQLGALVTQMREAGLRVAVTVEGEVQLLPPSVDLSAYRIVQEALTNTLKHGGTSEALVTVHYARQAVEVEVLDDGQGLGSHTQQNGSGKGLLGMQERVKLHGGELDVGPRAEGGFRVWARLPLGERSA